MTERKPTGVSIESWVDRQIREAAERGEFENLPGYGKPLASLDAPYDELWWIKGKLHREGFSPLPPSLALRKEAEDAKEAVRAARSERQVRGSSRRSTRRSARPCACPRPGRSSTWAPSTSRPRSRRGARPARPPSPARTPSPRSPDA